MAEPGPASVVVDTDVLSYLAKGDSRASLFREHLEGKLLAVSFMTVAELDRWALERRWGDKRRASLDELLKRFVVHSFTRQLALTWAEVTVQSARAGRIVHCADAWIAATAVLHGIPWLPTTSETSPESRSCSCSARRKRPQS